MPAYVEHAQAIAAELATVDGVQLVPDPPVTPMMHVYLRGEADRAGRDASAGSPPSGGCGPGRRPLPAELPGWRAVELTVGDATLDFTPAEVRALVAEILAG